MKNTSSAVRGANSTVLYVKPECEVAFHHCRSWAKQNRFLFMKPQTVKCKNNSYHMCQGGGLPQLYSQRSVLFLQEEKCHSMCICTICVILAVLLTHIILQLVMSITILRYLTSVSIGDT